MAKPQIKKYLAILVVSLFLVSAFAVISSAATNNKYYTVENQAVKGYHFVSEMQSNSYVTGEIYIPLKNADLLSFYVQQVSDPNSPMYEHYLKASQIENLFENKALFDSTLNYLKSNNIQIVGTAMNSIIIFRATTSQVKNDLGMNIGIYSNGSSKYYYSYGTPKIPNVMIFASNISSLLFDKPSTFVSSQDVKEMKNRFMEVNPVFSIEPYYTTWLQNVYNATGLYSKGYMGQGQTIGILDFAGDPYVQQALEEYDMMYGLPNPPNFNIVPIGPYNPMVGVITGWQGEIEMDVEASHTMAPMANITLFIANYDLNLGPVIAFIDQYAMNHTVDSLSQSFGISESYFANFPGPAVVYNLQMPDIYYEIGSIMGITFSASTGDTGGSGDGAGPLGATEYPSISPYVTAIGGSTVFVTVNSSFGVTGYENTAWSGYGFVAPHVNYGGGTGGISSLEAKPWYQKDMNTNTISPLPVGYTNGRMVPDISLEANVFPGMVFVFWYNGAFIPSISGGTSEASPLFAGLIVLASQYTQSMHMGGGMGLVNPLIYKFGLNSTIFKKVFEPMQFGYTIPWFVTGGYNLATGFGSINIGMFAHYASKVYSSMANPLTINAKILNPTNTTGMNEFIGGYNIKIAANITFNNINVTNGSFYAYIEDIYSNYNPVKLIYNSTLKEWLGEITVPKNASGMGYLIINGTYMNYSTSEFMQEFFGYLIYFLYPADSPYMMSVSQIPALVYYLNGTLVNNETIYYSVLMYSIFNNTYFNVYNGYSVITNGSVYYDIYDPSLSSINGVGILETMGGMGMFPFFNGDDLQGSLILSPEVIEPSTVTPGSDIFVEGTVLPPMNLYYMDPMAYSDSYYFSSIEFSLVSFTGKVYSSIVLPANTLGQLSVPVNVTPGYYVVEINSFYNSYSLGTWINGSFFGEIYVAPENLTPQLSISPSVVYEGQSPLITASIYAGKTPVEFGMFSLTIYPESLNYTYYTITNVENIPLYFDTDYNIWIAPPLYTTMPSESSSNVLSAILNGPYYWPGKYFVLPQGISVNGIPTPPTQQFASSLILLQGPELMITSPSNSNAPIYNSSTVTISGLTTGSLVQVNYPGGVMNATPVNGTFTVSIPLQNGENLIEVTAYDTNGYSNTQYVSVLYLPQIMKIETQMQKINESLNYINQEMHVAGANMNALKQNLTNLANNLTTLANDVSILNQTYAGKLTQLAQGLQTLAGKLNETKSAIETVASQANGGVNTSVDIGIVALIFALIAIAISALNMFRKKGGNNKQNS
ncbi:MAG: protease pro-enzyme activation domain-containing protein [Thermoplasmata archaeon]